MTAGELRAWLERYIPADAEVVIWGADDEPLILDTVSLNGVSGPSLPIDAVSKVDALLGRRGFVSFQGVERQTRLAPR